MKEITRIHIAKVAYDIEIEAKKTIQSYIAALEQYADDKELLNDIEIRITELLEERGVKRSDVITTEDVASIRSQLGEPREFASEDTGVIVIDETELSEAPKRKLYRDEDAAVLGGVLAGLARFFKLDPIIFRLLAVVLLFLSFGTVTIVYLVLWLVVPPARTAAEKLTMRGQAVTLEAIKHLNEQEHVKSMRQRSILRRTLRYFAGIVIIGLSVVTLAATIAVVAVTVFGVSGNLPTDAWQPFMTWWGVSAAILFALSGVIATILGIILADATFRKRWSKRISTAVIVLIASGVLLSVSGVSTLIYGMWQESVRYDEKREVKTVQLQNTFTQIKNLTITNQQESERIASIDYVVTSDAPRYTIDALPGAKVNVIPGTDNSSATLSVTLPNDQLSYAFGNTSSNLVIYGPALETLNVKQTSVSYSAQDKKQTALLVSNTHGTASVSGSYAAVTVESDETSTVSLQSAAIETLTVRHNGGLIEAGVVKTLSIQQPDACAARPTADYRNRVDVQAVSSGTLTYNGTERPAASIKNDCAQVVIGQDSDTEDAY